MNKRGEEPLTIGVNFKSNIEKHRNPIPKGKKTDRWKKKIKEYGNLIIVKIRIV